MEKVFAFFSETPRPPAIVGSAPRWTYVAIRCLMEVVHKRGYSRELKAATETHLRAGRSRVCLEQGGIKHSSGLFVFFILYLPGSAAPFCRLPGKPDPGGPGRSGPGISQQKEGHPIASHRAFPTGECPLPPLLGKTVTLSLPLTASRSPGDVPPFVTRHIQRKYLDGTFPGQVAHTQRGLEHTSTPAPGDGGTVYATATHTVRPPSPREGGHGDTSTSLCPHRAAGPARGSVQKPQSAKELKQPHC